MKRATLFVAAMAALFAASAIHAQLVVYDTVTTDPAAGYSEPNDNAPIFGDALTLDQAGQLAEVGFDLFNSSSGGNTGTINAGTMELKIYDNTNPFPGGGASLAASNPLLATIEVSLDFSDLGGLPAGFFTSISSGDLTSLNINLPLNIFITQQFTLTDGDSTRNGTILSADDSPVGSSPAYVYISSNATPEDLYSFGGSASANQFAFEVEINPAAVPEPATWLGASLLGIVLVSRFARARRA